MNAETRKLIDEMMATAKDTHAVAVFRKRIIETIKYHFKSGLDITNVFTDLELTERVIISPEQMIDFIVNFSETGEKVKPCILVKE